MVRSCRVERDLSGHSFLPDRLPVLCFKEIFVRFFFFILRNIPIFVPVLALLLTYTF